MQPAFNQSDHDFLFRPIQMFVRHRNHARNIVERDIYRDGKIISIWVRHDFDFGDFADFYPVQDNRCANRQPLNRFMEIHHVQIAGPAAHPQPQRHRNNDQERNNPRQNKCADCFLVWLLFHLISFPWLKIAVRFRSADCATIPADCPGR